MAGQAPDIVIVSGLPRSGTSMMMRMLAAGGLDLLVDEQRQPDSHNPYGYFEFAPVRRIAIDHAWLDQAQGKAVKVVVPLLMRLPARARCKVVLMHRDLEATARSQGRMIAAAGGDPGAPEDWTAPLAALQQEAQDWCARLGPGRTLAVSYEDCLRDPPAAAGRVAAFIAPDLPFPPDTAAMAAAVALPRPSV